MHLIAFVMATVVASFSAAEVADVDYIVIKPQPNSVFEDSSEFHRINKKHFLAVQLIGVGPNSTFSHGITYGQFLNRNKLYLVEITNNSFIEYALITSVEIKANSIGAHYKQFFGNTLYARGGADYRLLDYSNKNLPRSFKASSFAISFALGNQWDWEKFSAGCDWVGYSIPMTSSISNENFGSAGNSEVQLIREDQDRLVKAGVLHFIRVYVGATF